jgi:hypothetical protein
MTQEHDPPQIENIRELSIVMFILVTGIIAFLQIRNNKTADSKRLPEQDGSIVRVNMNNVSHIRGGKEHQTTTIFF